MDLRIFVQRPQTLDIVYPGFQYIPFNLKIMLLND